MSTIGAKMIPPDFHVFMASRSILKNAFFLAFYNIVLTKKRKEPNVTKAKPSINVFKRLKKRF